MRLSVRLQDLGSHTSEIHSKLVDIMQDRLVAAARQLTQDSLKWGQSGGDPSSDAVFVPSAALVSLRKQLTTLHAVLGPLLQREEVHYIFGRVASLYSEALAATFDSLQHPKLMVGAGPHGAGAAGAAGSAPNNPLARGLGVARGGAGGFSVSVTPQELAAWEELRRCNALFALQVGVSSQCPWLIGALHAALAPKHNIRELAKTCNAPRAAVCCKWRRTLLPTCCCKLRCYVYLTSSSRSYSAILASSSACERWCNLILSRLGPSFMRCAALQHRAIVYERQQCKLQCARGGVACGLPASSPVDFPPHCSAPNK